jgi:hypothetical protein
MFWSKYWAVNEGVCQLTIVATLVASLAENVLKLTYAYLYFKIFCMDKKPDSIKC